MIYDYKEDGENEMITDYLNEKLTEYRIVPINEINIEEVFMLMRTNTYFYSRTQLHELTLEECIDDIASFPPNINLQQKFYVGIYLGDCLIALLDFIEGFPSDNIVYIGFFMLNIDMHGKGAGKYLIETFIQSAKINEFEEIKLACYEANEIGYLFWTKMGFTTEKIPKRIVDEKEFNLIEMKMTLNN